MTSRFSLRRAGRLSALAAAALLVSGAGLAVAPAAGAGTPAPVGPTDITVLPSPMLVGQSVTILGTCPDGVQSAFVTVVEPDHDGVTVVATASLNVVSFSAQVVIPADWALG